MPTAAATLGRERLSSRLTGTVQVAPMLVWVVDCYLLIWLYLHHFVALHGPAANGLVPTLHRVFFLLVAVAFLALPLVAIWAAGLRNVATDGTHLLVTRESGRPAEIPLDQVIGISEWRASDLRTVRVTFDRKTPIGHSLRFLAPTRFSVPRGEPHPVVVALRETVAAVHSEKDVTRFGKRVASA
jgi:hypothetical protein